MAALLLQHAARDEEWPPPLGMKSLLLHTKGLLLPHAGPAITQPWLASPGVPLSQRAAHGQQWPPSLSMTLLLLLHTKGVWLVHAGPETMQLW